MRKDYLLRSKTESGRTGKRTRHICMLPTTESLQMEGHTQTENEGMEKGISCKWKPKEKAGVAIHTL